MMLGDFYKSFDRVTYVGRSEEQFKVVLTSLLNLSFDNPTMHTDLSNPPDANLRPSQFQSTECILEL